MLAWGWRIERTREGDSMALYNRTRRISQTSQVSHFAKNSVLFSSNSSCLLKGSLWTFRALYAHIHASENNVTHRKKILDTVLFKGRGTCYCIIHRGKPVNASFLATLVPLAYHPGNLCHFLSSFDHLCQCNEQTFDKFSQSKQRIKKKVIYSGWVGGTEGKR